MVVVLAPNGGGRGRPASIKWLCHLLRLLPLVVVVFARASVRGRGGCCLTSLCRIDVALLLFGGGGSCPCSLWLLPLRWCLRLHPLSVVVVALDKLSLVGSRQIKLEVRF